MAERGIEFLVADLYAYAGYYCNMVLGGEPDKALRQAFIDLRELKADVAYPLLLEWYHDYATGLWGKEDLLAATRLIESYVFRNTNELIEQDFYYFFSEREQRAIFGKRQSNLRATYLVSAFS